MTDIVIAHGICSPIRPKVATALDPYGVLYRAECWAQNEDGTGRRTDTDSMAPLHVATITVNPQAAVWAEYLLCRYMAANPGVGMRLLSTPLDKRNRTWAAKWGKLPPAWRQQCCKAVAPTGPAPAKRTAQHSAKPAAPRRKRPAPAPQRGGILARLFRRRR